MKIIFSDFDGTLTDGERLTPEFFDIINLIEKKNWRLVIVTGRSLAWGHFLTTHFPTVEVAILEGGGVALYKESGKFVQKTLVTDKDVERLREKTELLLQEVDGAVLSLDSQGRLTDRALEFREMSSSAIKKAHEFFDAHAVSYSQSSVHINFWCGEVSKYNAVSYLLKHVFPGVQEKDCLYFGDSLNDQSMFQFFANTVGVSNIKDCLEQLHFPPKVILEGQENRGPYGVLRYLEAGIKL